MDRTANSEKIKSLNLMERGRLREVCEFKLTRNLTKEQKADVMWLIEEIDRINASL